MTSSLIGAGKKDIDFRLEDFPLKAFYGQHDSLSIRFLVVKNQFVLMSIDMTSLPESAIEKMKQWIYHRTKEEHIFISVTHSFSSPHIPPVIKDSQTKNLSEILYKRIFEAMEEALKQALCSLSLSYMSYQEKECNVNVNRNVQTNQGYWLGENEEEFSDSTLRVISIHNEQGIYASLINFDVQSSVLDQYKHKDGHQYISSDVAGYLCKEIEKQNIISFFLPGSAGDQVFRKTKEDKYAFVEFMGQYLSKQVLSLLSDSKQETYFQFLSKQVLLDEQVMKYPTKELKPHKSFEFEKTGKQISVNIDVLFNCDMVWILTSPEINSEFGFRIRKMFKTPVFFITLVNGACKYLPEDQDYERITYTAMNTQIGQGSSHVFLKAIQDIKNEMEVAK
ncbi:MAG: hypothetical protein ACI4UK_03640 [Floccifex sp.]